MTDPKPPTHADLTAAGQLGRRLEKERARQADQRMALLTKQADALTELAAAGHSRIAAIIDEYSATVRELAGCSGG
jgi:hypothetical protein